MIASATFFSAKRSRPMRFPRAASTLPVARTAAATGSWRYQAPARPLSVRAGALIVAAALHAIFLLGFNGNSQPVRKVAPIAERIIQMEMPLIQPDEPEEKVEELRDTDAAASIPVPQLADRPSIDRPEDFTQLMDFSPVVALDPSALRQMTIPTNIGRGAGGNVASIFDVNQLDRVPTPTAQPAPVFPPQLKNSVTEARVTVNFIVDATGRVIDANVIDSTHRGFHEAAVDGVKRWKFRPGMKAGRRVATNMLVTIRFNIEEA